MSRSRHLARLGGAALSRRLLRSVPYLGAVVAIASLGVTMRRKGVIGGVVDTGLNALPFVGAAKTVAELVRGEDFIEDLPEVREPQRGELPLELPPRAPEGPTAS